MANNRHFNRHTITAALPYANGPVHIGHLAGVYIPADIYARYLRSRGEQTLFVCGSDEHGVPITIRAQKEGITPSQAVDKYHALIRDSFADFGISFDVYARTSNATHHRVASEFFKKLYDKGDFTEQESEQFYDEKAGQFLADRYIQGTCPRCGFENAYGDQCENCGSTLSPSELIEPRSMLSGSKPILKLTKHWYLPLNRYEAWLREWILESHKEWKANVYGQCKSWLDGGLQPRAVTRDLDWGVPLPIPHTEGKVLYVWFDAPIGYISATQDWAIANKADWKPWWQAPDTRLIHFIGKDNIVFHCIIFPAMLKAHGHYILPDNVPANEFLNLEGNKISTSRNWAVWLHEYLEAFPGRQDVLRYVLCANAPETKDNDFTWKDFQARNNNELAAILGNFVNRALVLTEKFFEGKVPKLYAFGELEQELAAKISIFPKLISDSIEQFRFREALACLMDLARAGNKYLAETEPWKATVEPDRKATILNLALQVVANLTILAEPFLPFSAQKLKEMLNLPSRKWNQAGSIHLLQPGHILGKPELLFSKIEDIQVQNQIDKLNATKLANELEKRQPSPVKPAVSKQQFDLLDIRIATIIEAEVVPKSKKLLKVKLDVGTDTRTVVSGIGEFYKPDKIIGQQVCLLSNLEAREIKGIISEGMILMAENKDGSLSFVSPTTNLWNGAVVN